MATSSSAGDLTAAIDRAREVLDDHTVETVAWHFNDSTGCPFWLEKKRELKFDPLTEIKCFEDLKKFPPFEDEWLRGGPVRRWVPQGIADQPIYVFETGGTTGVPKSRIAATDFRTDYSLFSDTLPEKYFPLGSNWLMLGPSGPRRLRLAVEHLAQHRGGICFCIDLDPRWVIKLIKKGWMEHLEAYKKHCIEQAITILSAGHDVRCMFGTPKLIEALCLELENRGSSIAETGITGIFSGGTEFTPQWTKFCVEELFGGPPQESGVYMTPTYGNTLMGLACSKPVTKEDGYKISYYAPQPRAAVEVVDFNNYDEVVPYGGTGRVKLTTLTKEFFVPGFLERDEGEREPPFAKYPWDGVSGVRPFHELADATTVGVYERRPMSQLPMITLPALRWGEPYESLDVEEIKHFLTGETVARVNTVGSGIVSRDAKKARRARQALQSLSPAELISCCKRAGELFESGVLAVGDGRQSADEFVAHTSATTGMPLTMVRGNVTKNAFVLKNIDKILDALTRGLDLNILARGYGDEGRGVTVSYQAQTDVLGAVLPSNSPGVHTLWLPVIALQIGLALKPGSQEPWTPYRVAAAMVEAGIPAEAISIYPGAGNEIGGAILSNYGRSMIFGGPQTIQQYAGSEKVQVHGPGYSKILLGDDVVDNWREYLPLLVDSVARNGGRSCINASSIYAPRHGREIASALAEQLGPVEPLPPDDPKASLAAFTTPGAAAAIWKAIERDLADSRTFHATADYGPRLVEQASCAYLRPTVWHCQSTECPGANKEYMFPAVGVVDCPQEKMLAEIGPTLVCTAITNDEAFRRELIAATCIDRLNLGPVPTPQVDWLQPHEGNLVEFLYRNRALQIA